MVSVALQPPSLPLLPPLTPPPPAAQALTTRDPDARSERELAAHANADGKAAAKAAAPAVHVSAPTASRPATVQDIIRSAFQPLGDASVNWAMRIAFCESTYNPNAVNASSGAMGLFQFLPTTWRSTPFAADSPFDPQANARAAAWLLQTYGPSQWECRA
jgi:hypothetical protein